MNLDIVKEINDLGERCLNGGKIYDGKQWQEGVDEIISKYNLSQRDWHICRELAIKTYGRIIK